MTTDRYQRLLELVHGRAGDAVRAAVAYTADDWTVLYVRDDMATGELQDALPTLMDRLRATEPTLDPNLYDRAGSAQATVELYEAAVIVHLPEGDASGVAISLDRDVAQGLGQFVNACNDVLDAG